MPLAPISPVQQQQQQIPLSSTQQDVQVADPTQSEEYNSFFDFSAAKSRITNLIKQWEVEIDNTKTRRAMRNIDVDLAQLYKDGKLKVDETFIPIRVIDSTIKRELPSYLSFLTQSRRLAIFSCIDDPQLDTNLIEAAFTKGMTYSGWQLPLFKVIDGAATHGWDTIELEYREDRPLKVNIDHVGHENLLFARDARDLEACEIILRRYELSVAQIKRFTEKFGWNPEQSKATYAKQEVSKDFKNVVLFKGMFKWEGRVYVFWTAETETSDWIKPPMPLSLGREETEEYTEIQYVQQPTQNGGLMDVPVPTRKNRQVPVFETAYPFKVLAYSETEQQAITDYKGRCFYDWPKQEAQTALWSVLVNGSVRASNVYAYSENNLDGGAQVKKLDLDLEAGRVYNQKMGFFNTPYPDPNLVRVSDGLETRQQIEAGQPAFAVNNRQQDSRKTATEMNVAQQQQSMLSSVSVTLLSVFMQKVLSHAWLMAQSQALYSNIAFLQIEQQQPPPMPGMPPQVQKVNDLQTISKFYDIRSAGDVDVTQRAEKLNRRMQVWPMISTTPLASTFLGDILKESFPEDADRYTKILEELAQQANAQQQMLGNVSNVLQHAVTDDSGQVKPEFKQHEPLLQQLKQQVMQTMQPPGVK